ncbi:MAG: hypothetical protein OQK70_09380 [Gammaproteobacteria bacterium]|nr:hypothetical protein [Gammaproteobacteria bacterium]MCW9057244.1 hypothetical protein [Gammaproteobacteria bacterium]
MKLDQMSLKSLAAFCLIFSSSSLYADQWHYNNVIIGERATGMGGAYTAISDDPSGLFHNPAGIVYGGSRNLSASVNAFSTSTTTYKGVLGGRDWERKSSALLPNFFGLTQPLGGGIIGFSYAVPDSVSEDQDSIFNNIGNPAVGTDIRDYLINVNNEDNTYKLGPSYAIEINDELSIGATLYLHVRDQELIANQWIRYNNDEMEWYNSYYQSSETGFEPILGIMWSPFDQFSLGMSIRQVSIMSSETSGQAICVSDKTGQTVAQCQPPVGGVAQDPTLGVSKVERDMPTQVNLGVAYFRSNDLLLSADMAFYTSTDTAESVMNLAFGAEYYTSESWAFRGGIYTNNSNAADISATGTDQPDQVDIIGLTFSASHFTRDSSITLGINYNMGSGDAQVLSGSTAIQDVDVSSLSFFVSSSLSY